MSLLWAILSVAYAMLSLWILFSIDYVPMLLFAGGVSVVAMFISFSALILSCLDIFNQKEIHRLKNEIKEIDEIIEKKKFLENLKQG